MPTYPYVLSKKRLIDFLQKIPNLGIPPKVDQKWLSTIGFDTDNDKRFLGVLKFLNFIDSNETPLDNYRNYRANKTKVVLANAIKTSYSELFNVHPNANSLPESELNVFFSGATSIGSVSVQRAVMTFQALCSIADFSNSNITNSMSQPQEATTPVTPTVTVASNNGAPDPSSFVAPTININIQLTVPDTKDSEVYNNFFAAMRKNLFH